MRKKQGFLIALEGVEGAGKTTQAAILVKKLQAAGRDALSFREPGGEPLAEKIRDLVLSRKNTDLAPFAETFLFMAARAQVYKQHILPARAHGQVVILDRTRDSSVVYQGMIKKQGVEAIETLNDLATQNTQPDLKILIDVPAKIGLNRVSDTSRNRFEDLGPAFHEKIRQGYLELASQDKSQRWVILDGNASLEKVSELIWEVVAQRLKLS